jgi:hypothetical protein
MCNGKTQTNPGVLWWPIFQINMNRCKANNGTISGGIQMLDGTTYIYSMSPKKE